MQIVLLTAVGVGSATIIGALLGFLFKNPSHKFNDIIMSFAAGVMLSAAVVGLILPALEYGEGKLSFISVILGIFFGAFCLNIIDKLVPHLHKISGVDAEKHPERQRQLNRILLFVISIAIHNIPEGIAAGVSFGGGNIRQALAVAGGIALQNIPEGMIIIAPMLASGISRKRTLLIGSLTGIVEVIGTFIGYFAANLSGAILPFALAFAGGTMLYVVSDEMIPETHSHGYARQATYALLLGFSFMLAVDFLIA